MVSRYSGYPMSNMGYGFGYGAMPYGDFMDDPRHPYGYNNMYADSMYPGYGNGMYGAYGGMGWGNSYYPMNMMNGYGGYGGYGGYPNRFARHGMLRRSMSFF